MTNKNKGNKGIRYIKSNNNLKSNLLKTIKDSVHKKSKISNSKIKPKKINKLGEESVVATATSPSPPLNLLPSAVSSAMLRELGRIITGSFYEHQLVRITENNRVRDIIRRKMEGIALTGKVEEKKSKEDKNADRDKYKDENIQDLLNKLVQTGGQNGITRKEYDYIQKVLEVQKNAEKYEQEYKNLMAEYIQVEPIYVQFLQHIRGISTILSANLIKEFGYCEKSPHISSLWKYTGYSVTNGEAPKRRKGQQLDFSVKLRTMCFPKDTLVTTSNGIKKIQEIKIGEKVLSHNGIFNEVKQLLNRKYIDKLVELYPYYTNIPIQMTPEHPVYAIKLKHYPNNTNSFRASKKIFNEKQINNKLKEKYSPKWTPAKELEIGDIILYPKILDKHLKTEIEINGKKISLDKKLMQLLGLFVAEGHISIRKYNPTGKNRSGDIGFSYNDKETELIKLTETLMYEIFGLKPNKINSYKNCFQVIYSNLNLALFFRECCGDKSATRKAPEWIFRTSLELQKEFFKYYYLGDGVNKPKTTKEKYSFSTTSKILANQIRQILINLNCFCSIVFYNNKNPRLDKLPTFPTYHCKINEQSYGQFNEIFNRQEIIPQLKAKSLWFDKNYAYVRLNDIKKIDYQGEVYNLEVENANSYTAQGIAVHNCWKISDSFVKQRTPIYRQIYDNEKARQLILLEKYEKEQEKLKKLAKLSKNTNKSRKDATVGFEYSDENSDDNQGSQYKEETLLNPASPMLPTYPKSLLHADLRARRKMVKIFLANYWMCCKEIMGVDVSQPENLPYAEAKLLHKHIISWKEVVKANKLLKEQKELSELSSQKVTKTKIKANKTK
jgi:hypothetical protein